MPAVARLITVPLCARCSQKHENLLFQPFLTPTLLTDPDGQGPYNYWGTCPLTQEPLLVLVRDPEHTLEKRYCQRPHVVLHQPEAANPGEEYLLRCYNNGQIMDIVLGAEAFLMLQRGGIEVLP